jgi:hypothetical protein
MAILDTATETRSILSGLHQKIFDFQALRRDCGSAPRGSPSRGADIRGRHSLASPAPLGHMDAYGDVAEWLKAAVC